MFLGTFALAAILTPLAAAAGNLLPNGTFDASLAGWGAKNATLALAADGIDGTKAARISLSGSSKRFSIETAASVRTIAGAHYLAEGFERSAAPGHKLCLIVEEFSSAKLVGSAKSCLTSTSTWQQFPQLDYAAAGDGHTVQLVIEETRASRGDSFEADSVTLSSPQVATPANTGTPTIAGTAVDGQTLAAAPGTWSGTVPIGYAYQWQSSDGTSWSNVAAGGSGSSYTVAHADVGLSLRVLVTASNQAGSASAASTPTGPVAPAPAVDVGSPTIAGSEVVGSTLTASPGSWSGTPPFGYDYRWQSSGGGSTWNDIGADAATYTIGEADLGAILRVTVTASNATGSAAATSASTQPITDSLLAPAAGRLPAIVGDAVDSTTLTADPGSWAGSSPISLSFRWLRCDAQGASCAPIDGATGQQYALQHTDEGSTITVAVTASNAVGTVSATSAPSGVVAPICGASSAATPPTTYAHVIWIWLENRSYNQIIGPAGSTVATRSPFVNDTVVPDCGLATNYHNVAHPSLPNYIAATSGSTQGLTHNSLHQFAVPSLFEQVQQAQLEWRSYEESMPQNCDPTDLDPYAADHNPALDYTSLATTCPTWDIPLGDTTSGAFALDLANDTLPAFSFVVPNGCNSTETCPVATGDAWLAEWLPLIVASPAYQSGTTAVFVTWDEGANGTNGEDCLANPADTSCQVAMLVLTQYTAPGTQSATLFSHYSLLQTTEQLLGLPLLGHAADATTASLRGDFHF